MDSTTDQLIVRGREAFERRDYASALADFRQVLAAHPHFADVRHLAGLCLSFLGHSEAALAEFDEALAINDRYVEAHLNRAITLNELGRLEEARDAFARATSHELDRGSGRFTAAEASRLANAHAAVADLYVESRAPAEAVPEFRRALELRPAFLDIRNRLGLAMLQLGDPEAAEAEFRQAIEVNPRFLAARLNLGLALLRRGERVAAQQTWSECATIAPENPQVRAFLAMLDAMPGTDTPEP